MFFKSFGKGPGPKPAPTVGAEPTQSVETESKRSAQIGNRNRGGKKSPPDEIQPQPVVAEKIASSPFARAEPNVFPERKIPPPSTEIRNERLRSQLLNLGERFIGFDKLIEHESMRTRRVDEERRDIIFSRIDEVEKLIFLEIKNRTEMNKEFQSDIELFCNTVIEKMTSRIARRVEKILAEIEMIETRLVTLERGQQQFRGELPSKLQVDTAALVKELSETKLKLEQDVVFWRAREEALVRKIDITMKNVFVSMEKYQMLEEDMIKKMNVDLDRLGAKKATKSDYIIKTISDIRQSVQLEEENRKFSDQEILNAINSYTLVLQRGLQQVIANKT
jgi:hypothetical protein